MGGPVHDLEAGGSISEKELRMVFEDNQGNIEIPPVSHLPIELKNEEDAISLGSASTFSQTVPPSMTSPSPPARPTPLSRTSSATITQNARIVPAAQCRGLLARFAFIPEVHNPYHYTRPTKWFLTFIVAFCAMAAPMGSAIVMPVLEEISREFHAPHTVTNMSVAVYMLSLGIFPLWWSSFSERLGRRTIYIVSFVVFIIFAVLSAVSSSIAMFIVMRVLSGGAAASVQAVGAGTIADVWEVKERGTAIGLFYLGPLCGPLFAPIIGGALGAGLGWRSTQWFLVVYGGITLIFIVFALPETLHISTMSSPSPIKSSKRPSKAEVQVQQLVTSAAGNATRGQSSVVNQTPTDASNTPKSLLYSINNNFIQPLTIVSWLRHPPILLTVYTASVTFGSLYMLNISIQATFSTPPYSFSTLPIGLSYIPPSLGYLLSSIFGGRWIDAIMHREARKAERYDEKGDLVFRPEERMRENAWIAAAGWPLALIVYGWTVRYGIHWFVPMIANFFFGLTSMHIFALANTMLTEFLPKRAASGIALNNFMRNLCSFTGAVVTDPLLGAVGNGYLMTGLGIWSLFTGLGAVGLLRRWGKKGEKVRVD